MLKDHLARTVSAVCLYRVLLYAQCILSDQENTTILVPSSTGCQETGPSGRMLRIDSCVLVLCQANVCYLSFGSL